MLAENNKRPGVQYAITVDGVELPVINITHPAFALSVSNAEQAALTEKFVATGPPFGRLPRPVREALLRFLLRGSMLAQGIQQARNSFMTGLHTYLLKLGPDMLGAAYAKTIDRRIAAALPGLAVRLRLQDVAHLMSDALVPALACEPRRPLHFINIAGGPAVDSLNTLILLAKNRPELLTDRQISIDVLDLDDHGPAFGAAALAALSGEAGPLRGLWVGFRHIRYDWGKAEGLQPSLSAARAQGALVICSSEGGLFEYGTDAEIAANLKTLRTYREVLAVAGSVTRADQPIQILRKSSSVPLHPRGLAAFRLLALAAGWDVARAVERPFSDQVVLT